MNLSTLINRYERPVICIAMSCYELTRSQFSCRLVNYCEKIPIQEARYFNDVEYLPEFKKLYSEKLHRSIGGSYVNPRFYRFEISEYSDDKKTDFIEIFKCYEELSKDKDNYLLIKAKDHLLKIVFNTTWYSFNLFEYDFNHSRWISFKNKWGKDVDYSVRHIDECCIDYRNNFLHSRWLASVLKDFGIRPFNVDDNFLVLPKEEDPELKKNKEIAKEKEIYVSSVSHEEPTIDFSKSEKEKNSSAKEDKNVSVQKSEVPSQHIKPTNKPTITTAVKKTKEKTIKPSVVEKKASKKPAKTTHKIDLKDFLNTNDGNGLAKPKSKDKEIVISIKNLNISKK